MKKRPPHAQDGVRILSFLDQHRLSHTPDHYAFAHDYLNGDDLRLRERVDDAIDGGIRLTEDQVQNLRPTIRIEALVPELDHIALRVLDVVTDAMATTNDLSTELVTASARLLDQPGTSVGPLLSILMGRAESAEVSFAQAARRAREIRAELAALQTVGLHDPLTGLANWKVLEQRLNEIGGAQVCLALVDIDGLRVINESHSPAVGDRLLKIVASTLADECRRYLVCRSGGGTFGILFENVDLQAAGELLARACEAIGARDMKVRETDRPLGRVAMSGGIVASRGRSRTELIDAARHQLCSAKLGGRDQVSVEGTMIGVPAFNKELGGDG